MTRLTRLLTGLASHRATRRSRPTLRQLWRMSGQAWDDRWQS